MEPPAREDASGREKALQVVVALVLGGPRAGERSFTGEDDDTVELG